MREEAREILDLVISVLVILGFIGFLFIMFWLMEAIVDWAKECWWFNATRCEEVIKWILS